ncbi:hypothetical protein SBA4_1490015 [Candidatus Sulfopaludibacter sp. SbA4]|nr:hypothetical protein SBA4_1490015 [Candidatus Sulfopaludibacter sp. SbA4]
MPRRRSARPGRLEGAGCACQAGESRRALRREAGGPHSGRLAHVRLEADCRRSDPHAHLGGGGATRATRRRRAGQRAGDHARSELQYGSAALRRRGDVHDAAAPRRRRTRRRGEDCGQRQLPDLRQQDLPAAEDREGRSAGDRFEVTRTLLELPVEIIFNVPGWRNRQTQRT